MRTSLVLGSLLLAACSGSSTLGTRVSPADAARTCTLAISCLGSAAPATPGSNCASDLVGGIGSGLGSFFVDAATLQHLLDCGTSSSDCSSALTCASQNHGPAYCAAHMGDSCDGDLRIYCASPTSWSLLNEDCSRVGEHCMVASGHASCTDGASCDPTMVSAHCDGDTFVDCDGSSHLESRVDCTRAFPGGTCLHRMTGMSSSTQCVPGGPSCADGSSHCDGNVAVACADGHEVRVDCANVDGTCGLDAMGNVSCMPTAHDCMPGSPDRCAGDALEICVNGRYVATACSAVGLHTCVTGMGDPHCAM